MYMGKWFGLLEEKEANLVSVQSMIVWLEMEAELQVGPVHAPSESHFRNMALYTESIGWSLQSSWPDTFAFWEVHSA